MLNSDILAFTETQVLPNDADNEIRRNLQPFDLFRQDHQRDKFMSLSVCTKDYIQITEHKYFSSINALKFVIANSKIIKMHHSYCFITSLQGSQADVRSHSIGTLSIDNEEDDDDE